MGELTILALLLGGGIIAVAVFMIVATFLRRRLGALISLFSLSILALFAQAGCWKVAAGLGRATGGGRGGDDSELLWIMALSLLTCLAWGLLLFGVRRPI